MSDADLRPIRSTTTAKALGAQESLSSTVVGLSITEAATAVTGLGDDGAGALAGGEAAAIRGTVLIGCTRTGDELGALLLSGSGSRSSGTVSTTSQELGSIVVGDVVTEAAPAVTFLSDDGSSTLSSPEAAASRSAVGIRGARSSDELRAGGGSGVSSVSGVAISSVSVASVALDASSIAGATAIGSIVAKAAPFTALIGHKGGSALARGEAAAAGSAVGIRSARASDELGALSSDEEGEGEESSELDDRGHFSGL